MIDIDVDLKGFDDTRIILDTLPRKIQKRVVKQSLRRGAVVIKKATKARVPSRTGNLKRSIKVRTGRTMKVQVFADAGKKSKNDGWYAHLIERGVKPHSLKRGASLRRNKLQDQGRQSPGFTGQYFMKKAAASSINTAIQATAKRFEELLMKEVRRK